LKRLTPPIGFIAGRISAMDRNFCNRILIVDDLEANLFSLEDALEPLNVKIDRAMSGAEAVRLVALHDYSVVLLDVQMPEMDGFDTAHAIFGLEKDRHPPIIFVTAISKEEHYIRRGYKFGLSPQQSQFLHGSSPPGSRKRTSGERVAAE
jgi:CheY-like chemotaxis protein